MMDAPRIIAITDQLQAEFGRWLENLELLLVSAAPERVLVLLRDRQLEACERMQIGRRLRELTRRHGQRLSVNDRLDLAVLLEADAVHLSESSVEPSDARAFGQRYARSFWVSRAVHDPEQVARVDADALLLSPIAAPRKGLPALGVTGLERARAARERRGAGARRCALYALGGVTPGNAARCLRAGADGVALIGSLLGPGAPQALVEQLGVRR